jgi:hypothetical protein
MLPPSRASQTTVIAVCVLAAGLLVAQGAPDPQISETYEVELTFSLICPANQPMPVSVSFTDANGEDTAEVFDPTFWGEQIGESFKLGPKCLSYDESAFRPPDFSANMSARPKRTGLLGEEVGGVTGEATLRGYTGHISSIGTFNGRYFEITFTSSAFRNQNWRCAMLTSFGFSWPRVPLGGWRKAKRPHK